MILRGESLKCCAIVRKQPRSGGYTVELPDLPEVSAMGTTEQEALTALSRRLNAHLDRLRSSDQPLPAFRDAADIPPTPGELCRVIVLIASSATSAGPPSR